MYRPHETGQLECCHVINRQPQFVPESQHHRQANEVYSMNTQIYKYLNYSIQHDTGLQVHL